MNFSQHIQPKPEDEERRNRIFKAAFDCRLDLVTYARALMGNYAAARDVVQEAMLVVVAKHETLAEGTSVLAWCRSIVRIEVLRANQRNQRKRAREQKMLDQLLQPCAQSGQKMSDQVLATATEGFNRTLVLCSSRLSPLNLLFLILVR